MIRHDPPIRLVASDLDGTLLAHDTQISSGNAAVLRAVAALGIEIVAATGRGRYSALERLEPVGVFRYAVCSNGAVVWDLALDEAVRWCSFDPFELAEVVAWLAAELPDCAVAWETRAGFNHDDTWSLLRPEATGHRVAGGPAGADGVAKILLADPDLGHADLVEAAGRLGVDVAVTWSGAPFLEIMPPGVDKATGLAWLCELLDVDPCDVIAFGDQRNDLAMLAWAGRGVAMANSAAEVLDAAGDIAGHHADDGVGTYLTALMGIEATGDEQ